MEIMKDINVKKLFPHPENPRKNIGDITELTESVKKNGIMQNLTVIPAESGDYTVIIGHRRLAAAQAAGLETVPCRIITDMDHKTQISTMLEENMQRSDLTVYEQAQGFQMMLDLGETEKTISEKTGFSKSTIRHRLKLAELDQELVKKRSDEKSGFQMSITDFYELEKIKDVEVRNKILEQANDSSNLKYRIEVELEAQKREKRKEHIIQILEDMGIEKAPAKIERERYSINFQILNYMGLANSEPVKEIKLDRRANKKKPIYYIETSYSIELIQEKEKGAKKELSEYEIRAKEVQKIKKQVKEAQKQMAAERKEFIAGILSEKYQTKDPEAEKKCWKAMLACEASLYRYSIMGYVFGKSLHDFGFSSEEQAARKRAEKDSWQQFEGYSMLQQMIIIADQSLKDGEKNLLTYNAEFAPDTAEKYKAVYEVLKLFGYSTTQEIDALLDGSSELYGEKKAEVGEEQ